MPSLQESRRLVEQELSSRDVHDDILASLQGEIDKHNAIKESVRHSLRYERDSTRTSRLRFKADHDDRTRRRKRRQRRHAQHDDHDVVFDQPTAHPFPRETRESEDPDLDAQTLNSDTAFRESLFDALADDEGAQYWETIYNQPIHIYPRPQVETAGGHLEQMSDEEYTNYVKMKMWERKNPEVVYAREKAVRERKRAEEQRAREREEFVRKKQQAAWDRAQTDEFGRGSRFAGGKPDHGEEADRAFAGHGNLAADTSGEGSSWKIFAAAWQKYLDAWTQLISQRGTTDTSGREKEEERETHAIGSKQIPWPVLANRPVTRPHIEEFFHHAPCHSIDERLLLLKNERVRWHPDKVQQRLMGTVDDKTMKIVTGVFQTIDGLLDEIRKR